VRSSAPMLMTIGNGAMGFAAIYLAWHGHPMLALIAILFGSILDTADGWTARKFGVSSESGATADMVSDLITFGFAPAALIGFDGSGTLSWIMGGLYLAAIIFRLIRFRLKNVTAKQFQGMPSPVTALAITSVAISMRRWFPELPIVEYVTPFISFVAISRIPFPKWGHPAIKLVPKSLLIAIYLVHFAAFLFFSAEAICSISLLYMIVAPMLMSAYNRKQESVPRMEAE